MKDRDGLAGQRPGGRQDIGKAGRGGICAWGAGGLENDKHRFAGNFEVERGPSGPFGIRQEKGRRGVANTKTRTVAPQACYAHAVYPLLPGAPPEERVPLTNSALWPREVY